MKTFDATQNRADFGRYFQRLASIPFSLILIYAIGITVVALQLKNFL